MSQRHHNGFIIPLLLLIATIFSTLFAGTYISGHELDQIMANPSLLLKGIPFSVSIILILGSHEMGHYLTARHFGIDVTLPYFIPFPNPMVGTMGAVIKIRQPIMNRRALLMLGASGPIVGILVALPILIYGLHTSHVESIMPNTIKEGDSILYLTLKHLVIGDIPVGFDVKINQYAYAGWLGILVTSLNLIPVAQLDGGHILYSLAPRLHERLTKLVPFILGAMGLFYWQGWLIWAILIVFIGRFKHPTPTFQELYPLDILIGIIGLLLFILTFTPVPMKII